MSLCSELVRERSTRRCENQGFMHEEVILDEKENEIEIVMYRKRVVWVIQRQIVICSMEEKMQLRTAKKERVFHPIDMSFFSTLEGIVRQRVLETLANRVVWNEDSPDIPRSFIWFVLVVSDKTVMSLKSFTLVTHPLHAVVLNFGKDNKIWLNQCWRFSVRFFSVQAEKSEGMRDVVIAGTRESLYEYYTSYILNVAVFIQITLRENGRGWKMRILHSSMRIVLDDLESSCSIGFSAST